MKYKPHYTFHNKTYISPINCSLLNPNIDAIFILIVRHMYSNFYENKRSLMFCTLSWSFVLFSYQGTLHPKRTAPGRWPVQQCGGLPSDQVQNPAVVIFNSVLLRETREGLPLLTVETEVNGDSKKTNDRGPHRMACWTCRAGTIDFSPALAALVSPVQNIFSTRPQPGQADALGRLSLCFWSYHLFKT